MKHTILFLMLCCIGLSLAVPKSNGIESLDASNSDSNTDFDIKPLDTLPTRERIFRSSPEQVEPTDRDMETANTFWFGRGLWGGPYGGYGGWGGWGGYGRYGWW